MEQFTASEVRTESCKQGQLHRQPASDMLNAFADLLEAREKVVPVAWLASCSGPICAAAAIYGLVELAIYLVHHLQWVAS